MRWASRPWPPCLAWMVSVARALGNACRRSRRTDHIPCSAAPLVPSLGVSHGDHDRWTLTRYTDSRDPKTWHPVVHVGIHEDDPSILSALDAHVSSLCLWHPSGAPYDDDLMDRSGHHLIWSRIAMTCAFHDKPRMLRACMQRIPMHVYPWDDHVLHDLMLEASDACMDVFCDRPPSHIWQRQCDHAGILVIRDGDVPTILRWIRYGGDIHHPSIIREGLWSIIRSVSDRARSADRLRAWYHQGWSTTSAEMECHVSIACVRHIWVEGFEICCRSSDLCAEALLPEIVGIMITRPYLALTVRSIIRTAVDHGWIPHGIPNPSLIACFMQMRDAADPSPEIDMMEAACRIARNDHPDTWPPIDVSTDRLRSFAHRIIPLMQDPLHMATWICFITPSSETVLADA